MLVVKIELWSAITHKVSEIGRMYIANDGDSGSAERGNYKAAVCRRGTDDVPHPLDPAGPKPTRAGEIKDYPRLAYNVWRMIARACLATFPEERVPKGTTPVLDAAVMRGLQLIRRGVGAGAASAEEWAHIEAANKWLDVSDTEIV